VAQYAVFELRKANTVSQYAEPDRDDLKLITGAKLKLDADKK